MHPSQLERFFQNRASASEREEVIRWLLNPSNDPAIRNWLKQNWDQISTYSTDTNPDIDKIWMNVLDRIGASEENQPEEPAVPIPLTSSKRSIYKQVAVLAAVFTGVSLMLTYYIRTNPTSPAEQGIVHKALEIQDIAPPRDSRAVLTLSDGKQVYLDSTVNGMLAQQGEVKVHRNKDGQLVYLGNSSVPDYNTLSIPKGSKPLKLVLSDGSMVWLNAASSITYPTSFAGKERKVTMTGEAYFEVSTLPGIPFFVEHENARVEVLGTHFNVNTDDMDHISRVTLLEGSVRVSSGKTTKIIRPGQQALVRVNQLSLIEDIDLEEVMAWKNGLFLFTGTGIKDIMKQLERYYDIEVEYQDDIPYQFVAKVSRDVPVSAFLEKLELTNLIHFKIEGKKIIVRK